MKREDLVAKLQGFEKADEVINFIMAENGKDITKVQADLTKANEALSKANEELKTLRPLKGKDTEYATLNAQYETLKKQVEVDKKLYKARVRNVDAVRALVDPTKDIDEEIKRLQKEESYLFDTSNRGTGKNEGGDDGSDSSKPTDEMYNAVFGNSGMSF